MKTMWYTLFRHKKWLILLLVLLVLGFGIVSGVKYFNDSSKPAAVGRVVSVRRSDIQSIVSSTGTISPVNSVDISSKITGLIKQVNVNENDKVTQGQILMLLDDTGRRSQVAQTQSVMRNAVANYERMKQLAAIGAVATQQFDAAAKDYEVAQATYDDSVSQLDDTVIKAPIDGSVIGKPVPACQTVAPGISNPMVLLTVADMSKMQILAQVDETDIGKTSIGQKASFTVDAYPGKIFTGVVSNISQKANVQQNVVYYPVTIDIAASENLLKPTMTARISIHAGESKNTLIIPLSAVKEQKGQPFVMIMANGQPQSVVVELGLVSDDKVEVLSGLNDGDQILLAASNSQKTLKPPALPGVPRM